ncbi:uncharacterized protein LOC142362677 [Opisthocomus hoazin]|uniref:uncharacterized protein LOC142362677 n=1 Tax=Opisthocomus hoazin TaxID=30419 RepID=UPI003F53A3E5
MHTKYFLYEKSLNSKDTAHSNYTLRRKKQARGCIVYPSCGRWARPFAVAERVGAVGARSSETTVPLELLYATAVLNSSQQSHLALSPTHAQGISLNFSLDIEMPEFQVKVLSCGSKFGSLTWSVFGGFVRDHPVHQKSLKNCFLKLDLPYVALLIWPVLEHIFQLSFFPIPSADVKPQDLSRSGRQWTPKEFGTGQAPRAVALKHPPSLQQLVASRLPATGALPGGKSCKTAWCRAAGNVGVPATGVQHKTPHVHLLHFETKLPIKREIPFLNVISVLSGLAAAAVKRLRGAEEPPVLPEPAGLEAGGDLGQAACLFGGGIHLWRFGLSPETVTLGKTSARCGQQKCCCMADA